MRATPPQDSESNCTIAKAFRPFRQRGGTLNFTGLATPRYVAERTLTLTRRDRPDLAVSRGALRLTYLANPKVSSYYFAPKSLQKWTFTSFCAISMSDFPLTVESSAGLRFSVSPISRIRERE